MADAKKTKADDSAEKAYAAAAAEPLGQGSKSAAPAEAEPVAFPPKGKRGRKPAAASPVDLIKAPAPVVVPEAVVRAAKEKAGLTPVESRKSEARLPEVPALAKRSEPAKAAAPAPVAKPLPVPVVPEARATPAVDVPAPREVSKAPVDAAPPPEVPVAQPVADAATQGPDITKIAVPNNATVPEVPTQSPLKDKIMDTTATYTDGFKGIIADAQTKAQEAFSKSTAAFGEYNDFAKGNVDAVVESGKILAAGLQDLGTNLVAESRSAFETLTAEFKDLSSVKSPADFFRLQSEFVRRNFDSAVAYGSKNTEAVLKLASEAAAPLSGRVSLAVEKVRQTA